MDSVLMKCRLYMGVLTIVLSFSGVSHAKVEADYIPLLIIGSSFSNGTTPIDNELNAPIGGIAVGAGSYLALGDALVHRSNGLVVNEAEVGAGTFDRVTCELTFCQQNAEWAGFDTQLEKVLLRVAQRDETFQITGYNANYLIIGLPNDCIHSDAFGIPQNDTTPCNIDDINLTVDRIKLVAQRAMEVNITPVIITHPKYEKLELSISQQLLRLLWVADEIQYRELSSTYRNRLTSELPSAIVINPWKNYEKREDGLHPNRKTVIKAANRIIEKIKEHEKKHQIDSNSYYK